MVCEKRTGETHCPSENLPHICFSAQEKGGGGGGWRENKRKQQHNKTRH